MSKEEILRALAEKIEEWNEGAVTGSLVLEVHMFKGGLAKSYLTEKKEISR